ncbi:MAG: Uma2 family endonuclease [Gammaproteobacteria bacterium]
MAAKAGEVKHVKAQRAVETTHPYRWSVAEFHKLAEAGIFTEDDRIELIEGELVEMAPIGSDHGGSVNRLNHKFTALLVNKAIVAVQNPILLGDKSEPQPDIALLRWRDDFYSVANPTPDDILLIIEIADTTARYDREVKVPLYARHGIPEVWLVDLRKRRLETYRKLNDGEYGEITHHRSGSIAPLLLPQAGIDVAELFGTPAMDSSSIG